MTSKVAVVGIEPTSRRFRAACPYQHRPYRTVDVARSCGGRNRTCRPVVQSHVFLPVETTPQSQEGRVGLEPTRWCLTGTCSAAELPTLIESTPRESNPPHQVGSLAPLPLGQGYVCFVETIAFVFPFSLLLSGLTQSSGGRRGSRTLKAVKLVPVRAGCHRQLACPSVFVSCGGRNRTCVTAVNSRLPVPTQNPPHQISQRGRI
jgi:hypothetical protein